MPELWPPSEFKCLLKGWCSEILLSLLESDLVAINTGVDATLDRISCCRVKWGTHPCAALCIEKLRVLKDGKQLCYTAADGTQFLVKVLSNLFSALKLLESQENHSTSGGLSWGSIHCGCQALCITMFGWANNCFSRILQEFFQSCFSLSSSVYWSRMWQTPYCFSDHDWVDWEQKAFISSK